MRRGSEGRRHGGGGGSGGGGGGWCSSGCGGVVIRSQEAQNLIVVFKMEKPHFVDGLRVRCI